MGCSEAHEEAGHSQLTLAKDGFDMSADMCVVAMVQAEAGSSPAASELIDELNSPRSSNRSRQPVATEQRNDRLEVKSKSRIDQSGQQVEHGALLLIVVTERALFRRFEVGEECSCGRSRAGPFRCVYCVLQCVSNGDKDQR